MNDQLSVTTDLFEHREVKDHFINDCCFGEDFAAWLLAEVAPLQASGFAFSQPIQEDYGWGFWARRGADPFWVALSYCGDGPTEEPAEWVVSIDYEPGFNLLKRLFYKPDAAAVGALRDHIWQSLRENRAITVHPPGT
jgi:hypothetical protein